MRIKRQYFATQVGRDVLWTQAQNEVEARANLEAGGESIPADARFWTVETMADAPADVQAVLSSS